MNILVTGGCGFIGSNFINFFHERYPTYNIINLDKIDYCSNVNNINKFAATNVKGNIHNKELLVHLIEKYNFDTVFHFAAQSHVDNSFIDPISFTMENTYGTHVLIDTFREIKPDIKFIHFSTDEVYGQTVGSIPFIETNILNPTNPYSASKAAAEMIVNSYIESFKMDIKIIRCNNVYGPNQYPEKLIPKFIKLLKENKKCTIHGYNSSLLRRAFIHVEDVVNATETVWKEGKSGEVYNISSDYELSVMEVTQLIIKTIKNTEGEDWRKWVTYVEDRPFNDNRYFINSEKLRQLGWKPQKNIEDLKIFIKENNN
jgi:dTDP-glucose 4,6-dehydratase